MMDETICSPLTKKFDVIISEPSNPWQAGVCNLFTREYFEICSRSLKPGGVLSLWLQTQEIPPENIKGILAALKSVFPHIIGFMINEGNVAVLASNQSLKVDLEALRNTFAKPELIADLKRVNVNSPESILARVGFTEAGVEKMTRGMAANVDDTNKLEFAVGRTYENRGFNNQNREMFVRNFSEPWPVIVLGKLDAAEKAQVMARTAEQALYAKRPALATTAWAQASVKEKPNALAYRVLCELQAQQGKTKEAVQSLRKALTIEPDNIGLLSSRGQMHLRSGNIVAAQVDFRRVNQLDPADPYARYMLAEIEASRSNVAALNVESMKLHAQTILKYLGDLPQQLDYVTGNPQVLMLAAVAHANLQEFEEAERLLRVYVELRPNSVTACRQLASLSIKKGNQAEADQWIKRAQELTQK